MAADDLLKQLLDDPALGWVVTQLGNIFSAASDMTKDAPGERVPTRPKPTTFKLYLDKVNDTADLQDKIEEWIERYEEDRSKVSKKKLVSDAARIMQTVLMLIEDLPYFGHWEEV